MSRARTISAIGLAVAATFAAAPLTASASAGEDPSGGAGLMTMVQSSALTSDGTGVDSPEPTAAAAEGQRGGPPVAAPPAAVPRPVTHLQAVANPVTAAWFVSQMPVAGDVLEMELSTTLPHKLKDLFADVLAARAKAYGKPAKRIVARWRVVEVHKDGQVKLELYQVETTYSGNWWTSPNNVDTVTYNSNAPTTELGLDIK